MPYRVAVVGAGIGAEHLVGYAQLPNRFEIAAICDLNMDRAKPLAEQYACELTADLDAVLADPAIDIVDVCLPPHLHLDVSCRALEAGKAVVCEKPLVASLAEADILATKIAETKGRVFPVFQYRYGIGMAQMQSVIEAGLAGRAFAASLETHWNRGADYYAIDWRGTWAGERGGAILGHAIHIHDLLTSILGPVESVYANLATRVNDIETEDCAALSIRMVSGALVTSSVTLGGASDHSRLRLMFEGVTVESDHAPYAPAQAPWHFFPRNPDQADELSNVLENVPVVLAGYAGLFDAIGDALDGKPSREVTFEDGRRSLEFVTAVYASARTNHPVTLPIAPSNPLYASWAPS
ncbi:MAG: Gfo/Idh/MocA family oxidoreductase [Boseongicola sp.]|nr:Gfo/Idh/MocA family oxidoreductase [Boseongicola sp.]MDD9978279.1 Gfo/Idh/MocA family oxidoreductase [Boseongicola sp.]